MNKLKRNTGIISGSILRQKIVWAVVAVIMAFGIYALVDMKKGCATSTPASMLQ